MAKTERPAVVAVFHDRLDAERAVDELRAAGFSDDAIGVAVRHGDVPEGTTDLTTDTGEAAEGAAAGAITGGLAGGLLGAAAVGLIPGIGPVLAAGALAGVLGGAAAGAAAGGALGALVGMGVPEEDARYYDEEFRAGRTLVSVRTDGRSNDARRILEQFGGYVHGYSSRAAYGTATGTTDTAVGHDTIAMGTGMSAGAGSSATAMGAGMPSERTFRESAASAGRPWDDVGTTYRQDWERTYGTTGGRWEDVEPFHRYSYERSTDQRFGGRGWDDIENDVRTDYGTWSRERGYRYDDQDWERHRPHFRDAWDRVSASRRHRSDFEADRPKGDDLPPIL